MYQIIFNSDQLNQVAKGAALTFNLTSVAGCSMRIENESQYTLEVWIENDIVHSIQPYSYCIFPIDGNYVLKVNPAIKTNLLQDYQFVSYIPVSGIKSFEQGSLNFNGNQNVSIQNSHLDVSIQNSQLDVNVLNSTLNAQIMNAQINSQVLNAMLATNTMVPFGSFDITISNLSAGADCPLQTAYIPAGFYDAVLIVAQSANGHSYIVSAANTYLKGNIATPANLTLGSTLHSPSNGWFNSLSYLTDANPFDTLQFTIRNNEAGTIANDTIHFNAYAFRSGTGSEAFPDRSGHYNYDIRSSSWKKNEANKDLTAITNGTHTGQNVGFYNYNHKGILITVNVQLSATGTLTIKLNGNTNQGNTITILSETISTSGVYTYLVYPGASGTGSGLTATVSSILPPNFFINTSFSDTSTWTYGVDLSLLN